AISFSLFLSVIFYLCCFFLFFFFFFQAEDGIRDLYVTGVQTCALPISPGRSLGDRSLECPGHGEEESGQIAAPVEPLDRGAQTRSEERRVGKECRSRWSPDH